MATTTLEPTSGHGHAEEVSFYGAERGLWSWLSTLDHKRIGIMYLVGTLAGFAAGGVLAILFRIELLTPDIDFFLSANATDIGNAMVEARATYNKFFTLHGALMVFVFIVPSIPAALGNFFLPLMLGAKDVAFPRLNLTSFYLWCIGTAILLVAILAGQLDAGWTFYAPYSLNPDKGSLPIIIATLGIFVLGFSSILTGVNFVVTVHKMRAPGMTWNRMPLFIWALYATAVIQILATPVLAITLLLLLLESVLQVGIFNPEFGGDPILYQHFFWFYSHPAVYIMILPGFGIISEVLTVHAKKHIFGYKAIALSSVSIAIISFLVWGHHMFVSGQSEFASALFSFLTMAVAIPTAIKVFSWVATLYGGSIQFTTAMWYGLAFIFTFTIGGLTGIFLGALSNDVHFHDSYFVVAHFHYVMMGGTVIALLAGLHHWFPKMFGRMYNEKAGYVGVFLVFIGFNVTFFTQFMLGSQGMPRRYAEYAEGFQTYHVISSIGSFILAAGLLWTLIYFIHGIFKGEKAGPNPWGGVSLEWATQSPPIHHNFHETPHVDADPYNFPQIDRSKSSGH
jgi:cytochrome c oxidase subunit 1